MTPAAATGYLAGLIDGEGTIQVRKYSCHIVIFNTERAVITGCEEACKDLGIEYRINCVPHDDDPNRKPCFRLCIARRAALKRCADLLVLHHPEKARRLAAIEATYSTSTPWMRIDEIDGVELARLYWEEGMTVRDLARHFGRTDGTVHRWMELKGIRRRSRAESISIGRRRALAAAGPGVLSAAGLNSQPDL